MVAGSPCRVKIRRRRRLVCAHMRPKSPAYCSSRDWSRFAQQGRRTAEVDDAGLLVLDGPRTRCVTLQRERTLAPEPLPVPFCALFVFRFPGPPALAQKHPAAAGCLAFAPPAPGATSREGM